MEKISYLIDANPPIMYSIVYVSTANPDLDVSTIESIFDDFRRKNDDRNIRGILMYSQGNFFQILETQYQDRQSIIDLFQRIKEDDRHYDVIKIIERRTEAECFTKYHTSFKTMVNPAEVSELYRFLKQEEKCNPGGYSDVAYLSQKFLALI